MIISVHIYEMAFFMYIFFKLTNVIIIMFITVDLFQTFNLRIKKSHFLYENCSEETSHYTESKA